MRTGLLQELAATEFRLWGIHRKAAVDCFAGKGYCPSFYCGLGFHSMKISYLASPTSFRAGVQRGVQKLVSRGQCVSSKQALYPVPS